LQARQPAYLDAMVGGLRLGLGPLISAWTPVTLSTPRSRNLLDAIAGEINNGAMIGLVEQWRRLEKPTRSRDWAVTIA